MNLSNKLKNLPKIYYFNLDEREDRKDHIETQYDYWGITNFKRISTSKFRSSEFDQWKSLVLNCKEEIYKNSKQHCSELAVSISYIDFMKDWLRESNDPYLFLMEDDMDLSYIEYWHFDWEYLMNNIPYDWDCIQLGFENEMIFPCFLHPIHPYHDLGACLLTRRYVQKLVDIHFKDGKYDFYQKINNFKWSAKKDWSFTNKNGYKMMGSAKPTVTLDYFICHSGNTYSLPLISVNPNIGSYDTNYIRQDRGDLDFTRRSYDLWWKKLRDTKTLVEFFTYGKPTDFYITRSNIDKL